MIRTRHARVLTLLLVLAAALAVWGAPPAAAATVTVSGTVSTPIGVENGGYVTLQAGSNNRQTRIAADGSFSMFAPEGTYVLSASGSSSSVNFQIAKRAFVVNGNTTVDLTLTACQITLEVTDTSGAQVNALTYVSCQPTIAGVEYQLMTSTTGTGSAAHWAIPGDTAESGAACKFHVEKGAAPPFDTDVVVTTTGDDTFALVVPLTYRVSGTAAIDAPGSYPYIFNAYDSNGDYYYTATSAAPGDYRRYAFDFLPGDTYDVQMNFMFEDGDLQGSEAHWVFDIEATADATRDFTFESRPVDLHFVDPDGEPVTTSFSYACQRDLGFDYKDSDGGNPYPASDHMSVSGGINGDVTLRQPLTNGGAHPWACSLSFPDDGDPNWTTVQVGYVEGDDLTVVLPSGAAFEGTAGEPADSDGVSNLVEAQAPNGGDGNDDGVSDAEQTHVTSLPANGAEYAAGVPYVTVAGPAGSTLSDVSTLDPSTLGTEPPPGTTLVGGLASFKLNVATPGATETVSVYAGDATGVNGYAKYDPVTEEWSVLPAGRVEVHDLDGTAQDHVDIELTDGGIGDADGLADGTITDPGGYAKTVQGDTTPPVVTGTPTRSPNGNGWYRGNVTIDWSATDADGEVASPPGDTVVSTQGADVTAQSPEVCDNAPTPNCARGTVTGLKIDKTDPSLSVTGVSNGATYVLGAVPSVGCAASDALSGLAGPCKGLLVGGNANKVGRFAYGATATDKAGNARVAAAAYEVAYRFDGFLQPVNDPALTPGAPVSVFKAGSVVPLAFSVKKANGQVVTPTSKPVWLGPIKGARTTASVNETVVKGTGTSGSTYLWKNNRWQFDWSTKGLAAGYLYKVGVKLDDGTTHQVTIGLR